MYLVLAFTCFHHRRADVVVQNLPAAALYASERRAWPVVGRNRSVQNLRQSYGATWFSVFHDVIEGVGLNHRRPARRAVKQFAKVVNRLLALCLLANQHIDP